MWHQFWIWTIQLLEHPHSFPEGLKLTK
jgi:hypothetical protein